MRRIVLLAVLAVALATTARAGRNANGAMVVHTDDSVQYTAGFGYCQTVTPAECWELNANSSHSVGTITVIWLLSAFPSDADPAVIALQFGIDHSLPPGEGHFVAYAPCGPDPMEFPDGGWPETGFGNQITFGQVATGLLFKFYWFAVAHGSSTDSFSTSVYPATGEARFYDDSNPPALDICTNFGTIRWDGAGTNTCPGAPVGGACCLCGGTCKMMTQDDCASNGGVYQGDGVLCAPGLCPNELGACCLANGNCEVTPCGYCTGTWQGPGTTCNPNPCPPRGSCCFCDWSCEMTTEADCAARGGEFWDPAGNCDANCYMELGACCLPDDRCFLEVCYSWCELIGGSYLGHGTECDPNPCTGVPVRPTTWGTIRALFR